MALGAMQITAQEQKREHQKRDKQERSHRFKDFTPEEVAAIKTKEMTLRFDLTENQQKEVQKLNLANAKERDAKRSAFKLEKGKRNGEKPSKEERLKMMNGRFDKQISNKKEMKRILSKDQFEKFERNQIHKRKKGQSNKQKSGMSKKQGRKKS